MKAMLLVALLPACGSTAMWIGSDGSSGKLHLTGDINTLTDETSNGRAGLLGMFGGGRSSDGSLARKRTFYQQANGQDFALTIGPGGITLTGTSLGHSTPTRAVGNFAHDIPVNLAAASVGSDMVAGTVDVLNNAIDNN